MKTPFSAIITLVFVYLLGGLAQGQTGSIDRDLNIVTRVAYEGIEFELELDFHNSPSEAGVYWKFKGIKAVEMTNSLGMTFRLIPAGTFMMGSPADEFGRESSETQHQVTLTKPFYMQTTEVTQDQWNAVMDANPAKFSSCGGDCPVEQVSWNDVQAFITALNALGIGTYRLPTEAEWEYAARAGSTTAFANGPVTEAECSDDPNLDGIGWYCYNADVMTHPVAQKQPNAWGLYDIHGNVWEWCQDWYLHDLGSASVIDPRGPATGSFRVARSGSWFSHTDWCRSAARNPYEPGHSSLVVGFRLARDN